MPLSLPNKDKKKKKIDEVEERLSPKKVSDLSFSEARAIREQYGSLKNYELATDKNRAKRIDEQMQDLNARRLVDAATARGTPVEAESYGKNNKWNDYTTVMSERKSDYDRAVEKLKKDLDAYSPIADVSGAKNYLDTTKAGYEYPVAFGKAMAERGAQFKNENAYRTEVRNAEAGWGDKYRDTADQSSEGANSRWEIYQENKKRIEELKKERDGLKAKEAEAAAEEEQRRYASVAPGVDPRRSAPRGRQSVYDGTPAKQTESDRITAEIDRLEAENRQYENTQMPTDRAVRSVVMSRDANAKLLGDLYDVDTIGDVREGDYEKYYNSSPLIRWMVAKEDPNQETYKFDRDWQDEYGLVDSYANYEYLTDEEKSTYFEMLHTAEAKAETEREMGVSEKTVKARYDQAVKDANSYIDELEIPLAARREFEEQQHRENAGVLGNIVGSALSVPLNLIGGTAAFLDDVSNLAQGKKINPYSVYHAPQNFASGVRSATANDMGAVGGFFYQAGMSTLDAVAGSGLLRDAYTVTMGMGAASQRARELFESGASDGQIIASALSSGIIEFATEKVSIDKLIGDFLESPAKGKADLIRKILTQGGVEASEEFAADILNTIQDNAILGSRSEWNKKIQELIDSGESPEEAKTKVFFETLGEALKSAAAGFISGAAMGGAFAPYQMSQYNSAVNAEGRSISAEEASALRNLANDITGVSDIALDKNAAKSVERAAKRYDKNASAKNTGKLSFALRDAVEKQNVADVRKAMSENGVSDEDVKEFAPLFERMAEDPDHTFFTEEETEKLLKNETLGKVYTDLFGPESSAGARMEKYALARAGVNAAEGGERTSVRAGSNLYNTPENIEAKVSDTGTMIDTETNGEITLESKDPIVQRDGKTYLNTSAGEISTENIKYANAKQAELIESVADLPQAVANTIVENYQGQENVREYVDGMREGILLYGYSGASMSAIPQSSLFSKLDKVDKNYALSVGRALAQNDAAVREKVIEIAEETSADSYKKSVVAENPGLVRNDKAKAARLSSNQIRTLDDFGKANGSRIEFVDELANGAEGEYDPNTATIRISLKAKDPVMVTLVHETIHRIRNVAPEAYNAISDFVQHGMTEKEWRDALNYRGVLYETTDVNVASEEMVADVMAALLKDTNLAKRFVAEHRSAAQKIRDVLHDIANAIARFLNGQRKGKVEEYRLTEIKTLQSRIIAAERLFENALKASSEAVNAAETKIAEAGLGIDEETKTVYSVRQSRRVTTEENARYMELAKDPVKNEAELQMLVDEAAELAMPDSAIRGKDGKLLKVFHGTEEDFNVFDTSIKGGVNGTAEGFGIYTSPDRRVTEHYGQRQIGMFANIKRPARSDQKTIRLNELSNLIKSSCEYEARALVDDGYDSIEDAIKDTWISNYVNTYEASSMNAAYMEAAQSILRMNDSDMSVVQEVMAGMGIRDYADAMAFYRESLVPVTGIDGFATEWNERETNEGIPVILALESNQLKSADPVTYDDNGNIIPLEERFNEEKDDIRYSLGRGKGYDGYSMSNNAREAYESGEMPISKWTKSAIVDAVTEINPEAAALIEKVNLKTLKDNLLEKTSWHHTSKMYNATDFYSVNEEAVENLTADKVKSWATRADTKATGREFRGDIHYLEWGGTRNHPKATEKVLNDVNIEERGSFYIVTDDNGKELLRKKIGSNGTSVFDYEAEARRTRERETANQERIDRVRNNSSAEATALFEQFLNDGYSSSMSGNLYARGRKPTQADVANGLENFFRKGEQRLVPSGEGYAVETWNGNDWESEARESRRGTAELVEQYGKIPEGERPFRNVEVPERTSRNRRVSQTARTVLEAEATPDTLVPSIEEMVADGDFSYETYTDDAAMEDAQTSIKRKGYATALADWINSVRKGQVSKANTTMGWELYRNAAESGDTESALTVLRYMVGHQRNAAQALQASRILKKMSPEAQLYNAQKSLEQLLDDIRKTNKNVPDITIDPALAEEFLNARDQKTRDEILGEIFQDVGRKIPPRLRDKFQAFRYLAMLGNPRTHIRNIAGNLFFAPVVAAKNLTGTAIESAVRFVSGGKFEGTKGNILGKGGAELFKAAWDDYANVMNEALGEGKYTEEGFANKSMREAQRIFRFKPLEAVRRFNSAALEVEDLWFNKPHYVMAMAQYCKARGITAEQIRSGEGLDAARQYAIKEAQKATYRDTNVFSDAVSKLGRYHGNNAVVKVGSKLVEGILPFRKTPANILVRGLEYSPAGLLKSITYDAVQVKKGNMTGAEMIDHLSAGLTGTGLAALGLLLASFGLVKGHGDDDDKKSAFDKLVGHQRYSLEIGGTSITLDWLAPEALPFFVGVNLYEEATKSKDGLKMADVLTSITSVTEPLMEMSCLQGLNDLFENIAYVKQNGMNALTGVVVSAATSYLTQYVPTILGQTERTFQDKRFSTYMDKNSWLPNGLQHTLGQVSAKIPGWDYNQIPYIDAWGRTEANGNFAVRAVSNFVNPAYMKQVNEDAMSEELLRLYNETGEASVFPQNAPRYIMVNGERKDFTPSEYVKFAQTQGTTAYAVVGKMVDNKGYKSLDDETKQEAVKLAYTYAKQSARASVGADVTEKWTSDAMAAKKAGVSPETYILAKAASSGFDSLKDKNGETIDKSKSLLQMQAIYNIEGISQSQRQYLIEHLVSAKSVWGYSKSQVDSELAKMKKQ